MMKLATLVSVAIVLGSCGPSDDERKQKVAQEIEGEMQPSAVTSLDKQSEDFELQAVTACDLLLNDNLVSSDSFKKQGRWTYTQADQIGTVQRNYSAQNVLGATVDSSYFCKFNGDTQRIVALKIFGPTAISVIVEDKGAALETARLDRVKEGAARAIANSDAPQPSGAKEQRWIVNLEMTGCPVASDWFAVQDAVRAGRWDVDVPRQCFKIPPGTVVLTRPEGNREQSTHNGHDYEKARLEGGRVFWTDELDSLSISPL